MRRSFRGTGLEPLGAVLRRDSDIRVPPSVETSPVAFADWEAAVGSRIAARARPARLDRGVLLITTASATWAQELSLLADDIVRQLRARGLAVDSLRFRVGHVDPPARPPMRDEVRTTPPEVPLPADLAAEVGRIADGDLREAIARAAGKNLGWQAAMGDTARGSKASKASTPSRGAGPTSPSSRPRTGRSGRR
jgi:hypothetical protein